MGERMKSVQHGELPPPTEDGVAGTQVDLADDFFLPGGEHSPRLTSSSTTDFDTAFDGHHGQLQRHEKEDADDGSNSDSPSGSSSTGDTAPSPASREFMVTEDGQAYRWPHPPPPPIASSPGQQSRISFHGARYGKFVAAYTGMERANVDEAVRRCRTISMIGLVWRREATLGIVTSRAFLRHSVLAVEGDALFIAMISQAETLTASAEMNLRKDFPYIDERLSTNVGASPTENGRGLSGGPRAQKRRAATSMQPNARCIALHYGLPGSTAYPQATLIVVVSTTRMEASAPIFISLESYYRCLDEQAWYRRFYGHHVPQTSPATAEAELDDILHGIKSFPRWPDQLSYYHGVGQRHVGTVAEAAFPFTLLDLSLTPELGENELGLNAAAPIPYATCLLYTGPSVSTAHVEKWLRSGGESTRNHATNAGKAPQPEEAEEDLHFAMDDTYALGLGKHGVCFGQGLSRYINHRYNLRRFGNVELCSVMITVPSDFVIPQGALPSHDRGKDRKKLCTSPTLPQKDRGSQRLADKKSQQRRKATSGKTRVPNKKSGHSAFKDRAIFHEEDSLCLTLPFFIATTDIEAGEPLLAWTYGDEYDAKLERSAVAGGFLIPYADGVLLNGSRLMMGSAGMPPTAPLKGLEHLFTWPPGKRWQRYGGDYRFSITVGDIVWRRRPFPSSNKNPATLIPSEVPISDDDSGCPFPEEDLFVVMDVIPNCTEWILLRPLERLQLSQKQLRTLFTEQGLSHHQFSSSATGPDRRSKGANRWEGWAVFDALLDLGNNNGTKSYDSGHSRQMDASLLHRCWVASTDSLALLLVDMDYTIGRDETPTGKAVRSPTSRKELLNYQIIISLEHLRSVTRPVRCGPRAMGPLTPLFNGILWPFFRTHYAAGYSPSTPG